MLRLFLLALFLATVNSLASAGDSAQAKRSLAFSCLGRPFVSVAALKPERDSFPAVDLTLIDPLGRKAGEESDGERIPDSSYGNIVQMPPHPERSKARAVEVCNAIQGVYELRIHELGNQPYLILASGSGDVDEDDSALLNHLGQKGRVRHYKFRFAIKNRKIALDWLDEQGHEQRTIETPEW